MKSKSYLKLVVLIFLLLFAAVQYILILRHKSPYVSDSYFYRHTYYQLQGYSWQEAYQKNRQALDFEKADIITANIFDDPDSYRKSYAFFSARTLYPYTAYLINLVVKNDYLAFLLPIFISYIGTVWLTFYFTTRGLNYFFSSLATAFLITFYPFLDWSTYFLTDVIGTFLWLLSIFFAYQYILNAKAKVLLLFMLTLILSLLNREQSVLALPLFFLLYLSMKIFRFPKVKTKIVLKLLLVTAPVVTSYLLFSTLKGNGSIIESLEYMRNNFGLTSYKFTTINNIFYLITSLKTTHRALLADLVRHHWWFVITFFGLASAVKTVFFTKEKKLIDLLFITSGLVSYLVIIWPFLSYRFLFPAIISIIYFSAKFLEDYYQKLEDRK